MELHVRRMMIDRWWPVVDGKFAQGGLVASAFATAAVLGALYWPGAREAAGLQQSILPATTAAVADTLRVDTDSNFDEAAAREIARRKIAEALNRQAAASPSTASTQPAMLNSLVASAAPTPAVATLDNQDFEKLANKAAEAIHMGDIAGARLVLEHAVLAGDTTAIYALAETYDPKVLAQLHVRGMQGDADKARALYEQARAKGVAKAQEKLAPSDK